MRGKISGRLPETISLNKYDKERIIDVGEYSKTETLKPMVSEYKFGYTTFIVETRFNLECSETLEDILKRLMISDTEEIINEE